MPAGPPGMCIVVGWEYAPRWSQPDNGFVSPDQADCAQQCLDDPTCSGATWILYDTPTTQKNCWFKEWAPPGTATPCEPDPSTTGNKQFNALIKAADCAAIEYKSEPLLCETEIPLGPEDAAAAPPTDAAVAPEEEVAAVPVSADAIPSEMELMGLATPYVATADVDYSPMDPGAAAPGATTVEDLAPSSQLTATACAEACIALPGCNAATWMGANPTWMNKNNCFLKTFGSECVVPPEAIAMPGAYLMIAQTDTCDMLPTEAPMTAPIAPLAAPIAPATADPLDAAVPTAVAPTDGGFDGFAAPATGGDVAAPAPTTDNRSIPPLAPSTQSGAEAGAVDGTSSAASVQAAALLAAAVSAVTVFFA